MGLRHRTTQNGEVLREHVDHTAIDRAPTGDNAVTCRLVLFHAELGAAVRLEHVELFKAVFVQQKVDPFARSQFALLVLTVDPALPPAQTGLAAAVFEFLENIFHSGGPS